MHIRGEYFEKILSGQKTLEVRINDEKRQVLKVGDIIEFENDDSEIIPCMIKKLTYYKSFADIFGADVNIQKAGHETKETALQAMYSFYSTDEEKEYGVVGIEIERV